MKLAPRVVAAVALALIVGACGDDGPTAVTPPPATEIFEPPFTGVLEINGAATQPFNATALGRVTLTIKALDPNPDLAVRISMALGTWNGQACQIIIANDSAGLGTVIYGVPTAAGRLCVRVSDAGNLTEPVAFDVTISHF